MIFVKVWRLTALFLVFFSVTATGIGVVIRGQLIAFNQLDLQIQHAIQQQPPTNLVFLGASQTAMGLVPEAFDAEMKANGENIHSYNLAIGGMSVVEMSYVIERLLSLAPAIRYYILFPCFECVNIARASPNARSIFFFNVSHAIEFIEYIRAFQRIPDPIVSKWLLARNILVSTSWHYTSIGLMGAGSSGLKAGEDAASTTLAERGYASINTTMDAQSAAEYIAAINRIEAIRPKCAEPRNSKADNACLDHGGDPVTDRMFEIFVKIINKIHQKKRSVLVGLPPSTWQWETEAAFAAKFRSRCTGPLFDYGDIGRNPELFLPSDIRYDNAHLNNKGALIWSKVLADKASNVLKTDGLLSDAAGPLCAN